MTLPFADADSTMTVISTINYAVIHSTSEEEIFIHQNQNAQAPSQMIEYCIIECLEMLLPALKTLFVD